MTDNNNMTLWNQWCDTPEDAPKKGVKIGSFSFTTIDAQWQIKRATQMWGAYGTTWGMKNLEWGTVGKLKTTYGKANTPMTGPAEITLTATFWYPDGEFPIGGDCYWRPNGDSRKKLLTDITTKALSKVGMCSDIFEGKFDGGRYNKPPPRQQAPYQAPPQNPSAPAQQTQQPQGVQSPQTTQPAPQTADLHPLFIEDSEAKTSTAGNAMVVASLIVTNGPHNGEKFKCFLTFGAGFAFNKTHRFVKCATGTEIQGDANPFDVAQMISGNSLMAKLQTKQYNDRDGNPREGLEIDGMAIEPIVDAPPNQPPVTAQQQMPPPTSDENIQLDEDIMLEDDEFL